MQISCKCKKLQIELKVFPKNTPGRLKCYCDDCQAYLHYLGRSELLDENGGTEVIPIYPADMQIIQGKENLKCMCMSDKGLFRFSSSCCDTPIANTRPGNPWAGVNRYAFSDLKELDEVLGPVRSSILGKFAKGTPPKGTPQTFDLKGFLTVMPYLFKGKILKKNRPSPFFTEDLKPIVLPHVLSLEERQKVRRLAGFSS